MIFPENLSPDSNAEEVRDVFLSRIPEDHSYRERLDYHFDVIFGTYSHLARYSYSVNNSRQYRWIFNYFSGRELENVRKAGLMGGIWGINTRIFDDLMDGDGCESPDDKQQFWHKYVSCFQGEEPDPDSEIEELAFWSAKLLVDNFNEENQKNFVNGLQTIMEVGSNEDKSTEEGYREYIRAAGTLGELTIECIKPAEGKQVTEGISRIGYEVGLVTQVADDIEDEDVELSDDKMLEIMSSERQKFETFTGKLFAFLFSNGYGTIAKMLYLLSDADSSNYDIEIF